jgi:hypothetical protein
MVTQQSHDGCMTVHTPIDWYETDDSNEDGSGGLDEDDSKRQRCIGVISRRQIRLTSRMKPFLDTWILIKSLSTLCNDALTDNALSVCGALRFRMPPRSFYVPALIKEAIVDGFFDYRVECRQL